MPGRRRDVALWGIIRRSDFAEILKKARAGLGSGSEQGYVREPENAIRDAALLAWEYLSGKRVSEFVGRVYYEDTYLGLLMDRWKITKVGETDVLQFHVRILKRYRRKKLCPRCQEKNPSGHKFCKSCGASLENATWDSHLKEVWKWKDIALSDPFTTYILEWLNHLKAKGYQGRIFAISRQHAWRIMNHLGIMNHINRHWRATHDASTKNIFELQEALDRATPPVEYVHGEPTMQLEKTRQAEENWK
jgi:hypothetical protein